MVSHQGPEKEQARVVQRQFLVTGRHHFIIQKPQSPVIFLDHTGCSKQGMQQEQQHASSLADRQE